ncbi:hypothetical protein BC937DRAFT_86382 [Endogone sp. FLAS-F59071]|nr:hypothetical protein BC937DRAFT_86382 [Endogone sp. FLAS-F59071]|eukprot:RUS20091.1 hypothetical protein BC937DRAFT_86382 [Endogone sp. FLAS-F59071]
MNVASQDCGFSRRSCSAPNEIPELALLGSHFAGVRAVPQHKSCRVPALRFLFGKGARHFQ